VLVFREKLKTLANAMGGEVIANTLKVHGVLSGARKQTWPTHLSVQDRVPPPYHVHSFDRITAFWDFFEE